MDRIAHLSIYILRSRWTELPPFNVSCWVDYHAQAYGVQTITTVKLNKGDNRLISPFYLSKKKCFQILNILCLLSYNQL